MELNSRDSGKSTKPSIEFTNEELCLLCALLELCNKRHYGTGFPVVAHDLHTKILDISGSLFSSTALSVVDPGINLYDHNGAFITSYSKDEFSIVL